MVHNSHAQCLDDARHMRWHVGHSLSTCKPGIKANDNGSMHYKPGILSLSVADQFRPKHNAQNWPGLPALMATPGKGKGHDARLQWPAHKGCKHTHLARPLCVMQVTSHKLYRHHTHRQALHAQIQTLYAQTDVTCTDVVYTLRRTCMHRHRQHPPAAAPWASK